MDLYNFDELEKKLKYAIKNYQEKKDKELVKLGRIYQREVKLLTPVDTGTLRNSITVGKPEGDSILVGVSGPAKEYAPYVENGYEQKKRFLPGKYLKGFNGKGVMLKPKFVKGAHMFKKGLYQAKPKLREEIQRFTRDLMKEFR